VNLPDNENTRDRTESGRVFLSRLDWFFGVILFAMAWAYYSILPLAWQHVDTLPTAALLPQPWAPHLGIHPHHLIHFPILKLTFQLAIWISGILGLVPPDAVRWMQSVNHFLAATCVALTFLTLRRLFINSPLALPTALACAGAYTFQHYALDGAQYMPALIWIWLMYFLLPWRVASIRAYIPSIIMLMLACLFHQISIISVVAILTHAWFYAPDSSRRIGFAFKVGVISVIAVAIPYLAIGTYGAMAFMKAVQGNPEFAGTTIFSLAEGYSGKTSYWAASFQEGFVRDAAAFIPLWLPEDPAVANIVGLFWFAFAGPPLLSIWTLITFRNFDVTLKRFVLVSFMPVAIYTIFQIFYAPWFYFFKLFIFLPFLIIMLGGLENLRQKREGRLPALLIMIFWGWAFAIFYLNALGQRNEWLGAGLTGPF
jgi:hypothetical protein